MEKYKVVGKVKDAHGLKGELNVLLFAKEAAWLKKLQTIRIKRSENSTDVTVLTLKSARLHKGALLLLTNELADRTEAEKYKGFFFEIPESFLVSESGEEIYLNEVAGFQVKALKQNLVANIVGFSSNGAQDLLVVEIPGQKVQFEIPFVQDFIKVIDYDNKSIEMVLPDGLLGDDLNEDALEVDE